MECCARCTMRRYRLRHESRLSGFFLVCDEFLWFWLCVWSFCVSFHEAFTICFLKAHWNNFSICFRSHAIRRNHEVDAMRIWRSSDYLVIQETCFTCSDSKEHLSHSRKFSVKFVNTLKPCSNVFTTENPWTTRKKSSHHKAREKAFNRFIRR